MITVINSVNFFPYFVSMSINRVRLSYVICTRETTSYTKKYPANTRIRYIQSLYIDIKYADKRTRQMTRKQNTL